MLLLLFTLLRHYAHRDDNGHEWDDQLVIPSEPMIFWQTTLRDTKEMCLAEPDEFLTEAIGTQTQVG